MLWAANRLGRRWVVTLAVALAPLACDDDGPSGGDGTIQVAVSPATLSVQAGSSGTVTVQLTRGGGFSGAVTIAVSGLPAGVTTTVTPSQLTGNTTSATIAVDVAATVAPGNYTASVQASAAGVGAATATYALTVTAAPNYTLAMNPAALSIAQGATGTSTVNITRSNFTGAVALSLVNPPAGITGTFNPASANDNSVLTIAVASTVAPGPVTLTVQGAAAGPGNKTTTLALTVTAAPDFALAMNPAALSVAQGASGTSTVNITRTNFTGAVALSLVNPPAGITGTFNPASTNDNSVLTVAVASSVAPGPVTLTVQGAATGPGNKTTTLALTVTAAPDFALAVNPAALSVAQGATGTSQVTVTRTNFTGAVALSLVNPPAGITGTFNPASTNDSSVFTVAVASTVAPGTVTLTIQGAATGAGNKTTTLALTVTTSPSYSLALNPTSVTLAPGGTATSALAITRLNGFTGAVALALDNPPAGITATFNPASVTADASTMTVNVAATVVAGTYTLSVQGTATGLTPRTAQLTVIVTAPSFTVSLAPAVLTMQQGTSATSAVTIGRTTFTGIVALSLDTPPTGITGTFAPASTAGTTSTLTLNVAATTAVGTYTLTVRGTVAGLPDRTATLQVTVTALPTSIAIALVPTALSVQQGNSGTTNVGITRTNFTSVVTLAATGVPAGVTVSFNPPTTTANTSTATIAVAAGTPVGVTPITITASGTGVTAASATVTLTITTPGTGTNSEWQFCSVSEVPVFFAFQDGSGPWQRVSSTTTGTVTKFNFSITQNRGGVAYIVMRDDALVARDASAVSLRNSGRQVRALLEKRNQVRGAPRSLRSGSYARRSFATTYETQVMFGTASELTTLGVDNCATTQTTKTINGTVAGVGAGQLASLSLGGASTTFLGGISQPAVTFEGVALGTVDFVGTRSNLTAPPDKVVLMRNLNIPDGGSLPATIDFNAASAFAPVTATATVANGLGDELILISQLTTANGQTASFFTDITQGTSTTRTWAGLPSNQIVNGDVHSLFLIATSSGTSPTDFRFHTQYVTQVGNQTLTLGPKMAAPAVTTAASGTYPRFRFQGTLPAEYRQGVSITAMQAQTASNSISIFATAGYLAIIGSASQFDLTMPDIAGLTGFPAASRLSAGANEISTTGFGWTGSGILEPRPVDGGIFRLGSHMTTLSVP